MDFTAFPAKVFYPRTQRWYEDDWRNLSTWCTTTYGQGNWEFINNNFLFKSEGDAMLFKLRWIA